MTIPDVGVTALGLLADSALTFDNPTTAIRAAALEAALAARYSTAETLVAAARTFEAYLAEPAGVVNPQVVGDLRNAAKIVEESATGLPNDLFDDRLALVGRIRRLVDQLHETGRD